MKKIITIIIMHKNNLFFVATLLLSSALLADVVEFKNGATLDGMVLKQDAETLTINVAGEVTTYAQSDIQRIELTKREISSPPSPKSSVLESSKQQNTYDVLYPDRGGFSLANTEVGTLNYGLWTYVRYSNQTHIDDNYVDESGNDQEITQHLRNDVYINKVSMQFKGWLFDEDFDYLFFLWTSNSHYSEGGNIAVIGSFNYGLTDNLKVGAGIQGLPTSRAMELVHPRLNRVDMRSMAGEYFRGSFAYGFWLEGSLSENTYFRTMLGNNMNAVGINFDQLDDKMDTFSTGVWWMSDSKNTDKAYGGAFGDFEHHESIASRVGIHYTHSTETRQGQADEDAIENSQIRLSGGTPIFQSDIFHSDTDNPADSKNLDELRYQMVAMDAGIKYRGFALDGEVYFRYLDNFKMLIDTDLGFSSLTDTGFSIQPSYMLIAKKLQLYAEGSQIYSDRYTDPWNAVLGLNWYPTDRTGYITQLRVNADVQYSDQSAVGNASLPYVLHGHGFYYTANVEM